MPNDPQKPDSNNKESTDKLSVHAPSLSLPKGGGAIRGTGEKFAANPVSGTGSLTVPIYTNPGRSGFGPQLSVAYDSGSEMVHSVSAGPWRSRPSRARRTRAYPNTTNR
jgi:hypothetical protein